MLPTSWALHLALLEVSAVSWLAQIPGVRDMYGLTHCLWPGHLGADSALAMLLGGNPRQLSATGDPTTVLRDIWSNIVRSTLQN